MKKGPVTPKGFRDIAPTLAKKRREVIGKIVQVLEEFDFVPLETPTVEFADTLKGKYGEEEKLIYEFTDKGGRRLALRYDLTVPLARYVANNLGVLSPIFSRYQIGQVFRGENPQKGRYREFTQFDFDIVGGNLEQDAKVVACAIKAARKIGLDKASMAINDRKNFEGMPKKAIIAWDKYHKIGEKGVKREINDDNIFQTLNQLGETEDFQKLANILESKYGLKKGKDFFFDKTLARGLDYYTGLIFELKLTGKPDELSVGGGGRYDNLIGMFAGRQIPAVGFSFGLDRLIEFTK